MQRQALRKLIMIDASESLEDLRLPPGNHFERLSGDRRGQYSIRINQQWRFCCRWSQGDAHDVEIVDDHEESDMGSRKLQPIHPGEVLLEEFLRPLGVSQYRLAKDIKVSPRRINEIVHGKRSITADTALRLARFFGTSERFWMNLQVRHDLEVEKDRLAGVLEHEVLVYRSA